MARTARSCCSRTFILLRNVLIASLAYSTVVLTLSLLQKGTPNPFAKPPPAPSTKKPPTSLGSGTNSALRPASLVVARDDYMGARPHVDTMANLTRLVEACRGSLEGLERMYRVGDCVDYLDRKEGEYFYMPTEKPSQQDGYPSIEEAEKPTEKKIGTCPGPVIQYHTYWTGPATWRVELFVKSYLWTQNLACSRLNIWLDEDLYENAVADMMKDKLFTRFLPLVERGDILLRAWKFPSRIPLPPGLGSKLADGPNVKLRLLKRTDPASQADALPSDKDKDKETHIGESLIRKSDGSEWLSITPRQMTFLPVAVSDAVRFIVLHLHGGLYCDMDVMFLRDMRPLLLTPNANFAERWGAHNHPGDYNTAIMGLEKMSGLSSYLLYGGIRMGLNFHPRIIGRMAYKDGRSAEWHMLETALFDPVWTQFNWQRQGPCTIPCFHDYGEAFVGERREVLGSNEWEAYKGPKLKETIVPAGRLTPRSPEMMTIKKDSEEVEPYDFELDRYPPNNRTMQNFLRGTFTYHIHNQVCISSFFGGDAC